MLEWKGLWKRELRNSAMNVESLNRFPLLITKHSSNHFLFFLLRYSPHFVVSATTHPINSFNFRISLFNSLRSWENYIQITKCINDVLVPGYFRGERGTVSKQEF